MSSKAKIYLYKAGNECKAITGGWSLSNSNITNIDNIFTFTTSNTTARAGISSSNLINFSKFDKISFTDLIGELTGIATGGAIRIDSVKHPTNNSYLIKEFEIINGNNRTINHSFIEFGISDVVGEYYLNLFKGLSSNGNSMMSLSFSNAYLETKENVISINSQNTSSVNFSCNNLDNLITITKAEVYINNKLSKSYNNNFDNITYDIDKNLCTIGTNNIKIKVTYSQGDDIYETVEEVLTHTNTVNNLSTSSSLKELINRQELLTNSIEIQKNTLKSILESKNVEVSEGENKLSILINKVNELGESPIKWLYKEGDECSSITGGWSKGGYTRGSATLTKNSNNMQLYSSNAGNQTASVLTNNKINLVGYSKLIFDLNLTIKGTGEWGSCSVANTRTTSSSKGEVIKSGAWNRNEYSSENVQVVIDVSEISASHYINVTTDTTTTSTATIIIKNVYLIK